MCHYNSMFCSDYRMYEFCSPLDLLTLACARVRNERVMRKLLSVSCSTHAEAGRIFCSFSPFPSPSCFARGSDFENRYVQARSVISV